MDRGITWASQPGRSARATRSSSAARRSILRERFAVIFTLYLLLSLGIASAAAGALHVRSTLALADPPAAVPHAKYLVLIVLDGARPDYFGLTRLPHVDALRAHGTQFTYTMDGILESETPSGHTTLTTGSTPARDGILGFDWAQNDNDFSLFSPAVVRAGAMERIMASAHVPTLAGLYKAHYPHARVVALSGHKYYAADPLGGPSADAIMYYQGDAQGRYVPVAIPGHVPPWRVLAAKDVIGPNTHLPDGREDDLATSLALSAFHVMHQRLTLINFPEFDWPLGHVAGGNLDPRRVITLMRYFDYDLGRIEDAYRKAHILRKTLFVITADHGMAPLRRFVPKSVFTKAVAQAGTTAPAISYNAGTYIWLRDPTRARLVALDVLAARDPGIQSAYYLTTVRGKPQYQRAGGALVSPEVDAANRYLLSTLINGHQPQVVVFCKTTATGSSPATGWKADHGGSGWQSQHIPLIISGPGIREGVISGGPAQLDDVAPTILRAMGVAPTGMQGRVLTDALQAPTSADLRARKAEVSQINPLENALIAQDNYETAH